MKILVVNGPNLNNLGKRDESHYGSESFSDVITAIEKFSKELGAETNFFQSNIFILNLNEGFSDSTT